MTSPENIERAVEAIDKALFWRRLIMANDSDNMQDYFRTVYDAYQSDNSNFFRLFSLMTIINGGLLYVLKETNTITLQSLIAFVGISQSLIWAGLQRRYATWCKWYANQLGLSEIDNLTHITCKPKTEVFQNHSSKFALRDYLLTEEFIYWITNVERILPYNNNPRMLSRITNFLLTIFWTLLEYKTIGMSIRKGACYLPLMFALAWIVVFVLILNGFLIEKDVTPIQIYNL